MPSQTTASSGATDLVRGFGGVLLRHKLVFLLGILLGAAVCAGVYAITPKVYVSNSQLLILKKRPEGVAVETRDALDDFVGTHQGLLKSPLLVKIAIRDGQLDTRPALREEGRELPESILRNLTVSRQRDSMGLGTSILTLSYRATDPADASAVLQALLDAYSKKIGEFYSRSTDDVRDMFERARDVLSRELLDKESVYREFRKKSPLLWKGKDGVNPHQERLANLETKRATLLLQQAETQGKLTALENAANSGVDRDTLLAMVSDSAKPEVESIRQNQVGRWQEQVLLLVQQEQKLRERFGDDHPEVKSVRESLAAARSFLNRPAAAAEGTIGKAIDPVRARIASLRQELEQLKTTESLVSRLCRDETEAASKLSGYEVEDEMHRNDLQRTQQLFETLLKRLQDASLAKDSGGFEATPIAPPGSDGVKKVQPSGLLFGSAALLLGLVLGTGFAMLAEMRDHRFRNVDDVRSLLELPMLGRIPRLASRRARNATVLLTTVAERTSPSAEAFRGLRSTLATALGDGKVLQVASPRTGDGSTSLAANLAVVLAAAGKRVVLVEANLSAPRLADVFGRKSVAGIVALLRGDGPLDQFLVPGPIPNLSLLLAEHRLGAPGDVLAGPDFAALISALRERFDLVILDGPPLLSRADAMGLVGLTDGVLLGVNFVRTDRPDAVRAVEVLREVNARIVGIVVNEANAAESFGS
jgi:polysaccharide biosynthesis transport protein